MGYPSIHLSTDSTTAKLPWQQAEPTGEDTTRMLTSKERSNSHPSTYRPSKYGTDCERSERSVVADVSPCLLSRQQMTIDDRGYIKVKIGTSGRKDRLKLPAADRAPTLHPCFQATLQCNINIFLFNTTRGITISEAAFLFC